MQQPAGAVAWPRVFLALAAAVGLAVATMPAAIAQEDEEEDTGVACDAEVFVEDEDFEVYLVEAGQTVECEAWGLEPEADAEWLVEYFDLFHDEDEPVGDDGDVLPANEDGELTFEFTVPDDIVIGVFEGFVAQPPEEEEVDYLEEFFGFILGLGPMVCEPDPVTQGESVACQAEEMTPDEEFLWAVQFLTLDDLLALAEDDDEFEDLIEPDIEGEGTADANGVGEFEFNVPAEGDFDLYLAVAAQDDYLAVYPGEIEPAEAPPAPQPEEPQEEAPTPAPVPRPTRVDTGAGGTATTGSATALLLALALGSGAALGIRQRLLRGER